MTQNCSKEDTADLICLTGKFISKLDQSNIKLTK